MARIQTALAHAAISGLGQRVISALLGSTAQTRATVACACRTMKATRFVSRCAQTRGIAATMPRLFWAMRQQAVRVPAPTCGQGRTAARVRWVTTLPHAARALLDTVVIPTAPCTAPPTTVAITPSASAGIDQNASASAETNGQARTAPHVLFSTMAQAQPTAIGVQRATLECFRTAHVFALLPMTVAEMRSV